MEKRVTFTVFTPTYNRAHLLPRAYQSLREQTFRDFEWLIVDDGSTDGTESLVKQWQQEADFPIRYYWQENRGKHTAHNRAVERAAGGLFVGLDSDDWLVPNALERILHHWHSIPTEKRDEFVGVAGLCAYPDGKIVGTPFPEPVMDANAITIRTLYGVEGDKIGMNRTEVLRHFPFPEDLGRFVPEALVWRRIARSLKERYVNEILAYKEYHPDGLSSLLTNRILSLKRRRELAPAMRIYYREFGELPAPWTSFKSRWRAYVEFVRFSLFAQKGLFSQFGEAQRKGLFLLAAPMGLALYLRDRYRLERLQRQGS